MKLLISALSLLTITSGISARIFLDSPSSTVSNNQISLRRTNTKDDIDVKLKPWNNLITNARIDLWPLSKNDKQVSDSADLLCYKNYAKTFAEFVKAHPTVIFKLADSAPANTSLSFGGIGANGYGENGNRIDHLVFFTSDLWSLDGSIKHTVINTFHYEDFCTIVTTNSTINSVMTPDGFLWIGTESSVWGRSSTVSGWQYVVASTYISDIIFH